MRKIPLIILSILLSATACKAGKGSSYDIATTPSGDDTVIVIDVDDLSMSLTGTTKQLRLKDLPISDPVQTALDNYEPRVTEGSLPDRSVTADDLALLLNLINHTVTLAREVYNPNPAANLTWQGKIMPGIAGEALAAGDLLYRKYDTDGPRYFRFSANSTATDNDTYRCVGIATEAAAAAGDDVTVGIGHGVWRDDSLAFANATDEGKPVFAGETAGAVTITRPADSGDKIIHLGNLLDEDEIEFYFESYPDVEVP